MFNEAMDVLYGENVFQAHRIDETNKNAALIRHAKFVIGSTNIESGKRDCLGLAKFLDTHPKLKFLELKFSYGLLEDSNVQDILTNTIFTFEFSSGLSILSDIEYSLNATQLLETVKNVALLKKVTPRPINEKKEKI